MTLIAGLVAVFAGSASSARAATNISMAFPNADPVVQSIVSGFEKANPDIKVTLQRPPLATYEPSLVVQLRSGAAPDVFFTNAGTGTVASVQILARAGYVSPLPSLQNQLSGPLAPYKPLVSYKGKVYATPLSVAVVTGYYDTAAFKRMGLKVPKTFDQVLKLCRTVRKSGKSLFFQAGAVPTLNALVLSMMSTQEVYSTDLKWNIKRTQGKVKFAGDPNWARTLRNFRSMGNAGCFNDGAIGVSFTAAPSAWARGNSLGFIGSILAGNVYTSSTPNIKLASFAFPATKAANTRVLLAPASNLAINAKSGEKAAASKLVDWFARPDQQRLFNKAQGGALSPIDYMEGKLPALYRPLRSYFKDKKVVMSPDFKAKPAFFLAKASGAQALLLGKTSIAAVLGEFDRSWDR